MTHVVYPIQMEIAGDTAMFTRPDSGDTPCSYPVPTFATVVGLMQAILWLPTVRIVPRRVEICKPLVYHSYTCNYGGPLRKKKNILSDTNYQQFATVLTDVCYRLYADVLPERDRARLPQSALDWDRRTTSPGHAYQAIFNRRLARGQSYASLALGWHEMTPSYFGPFREETRVLDTLPDILIPSMLRQTFSDGPHSAFNPVYDTDLCIHQGVLDYPQRGETIP